MDEVEVEDEDEDEDEEDEDEDEDEDEEADEDEAKRLFRVLISSIVAIGRRYSLGSANSSRE
jgi:hypothetical protein